MSDDGGSYGPNLEGLSQDILDLLVCTAAGAKTEAAERMCTITRGGDEAIYTMAATLISLLAAHLASGQDTTTPGFWGVEFTDALDGDKVADARDVAAHSPAAVSIGQMAAAALNDDSATLFALLTAAFSSGDLGWLMELISLGAGIVTEQIRARIDGHSYTSCGICECPEATAIPAGGFTKAPTVFGPTYSPHESWCPAKAPPD